MVTTETIPAREAAKPQDRAVLRATPSLRDEVFAQVRRRTIFECCKWDPQVEDVSVLAPMALLIRPSTWQELAHLSEALASETLAAEREIIARPELHRRLGLPRRIRRALTARGARDDSPQIAPVMRFDFHLTPDGWRITEVNSDVPGGFIESSGFTRLMAEQIPGTRITADPAAALSNSIAAQLPDRALVGLVHATAYTDDRQVMIFLARHLESHGLRTCLLAPDQIDWTDGRARITTDWCRDEAAALLRFFPGEWLANLPRRCAWEHFFTSSKTPLCNPATALVTQSKRFPLVWDELDTPLPTWRALLPETRDPRQIDRRDAGEWVLKPALGRVGDAIGMTGVTQVKEMKKITRWSRWWPRQWAAQRRFETLPIESDYGPLFPCLGIYTIDGRAAGIYGRASPTPLIDHRAYDIAVLIED